MEEIMKTKTGVAVAVWAFLMGLLCVSSLGYAGMEKSDVYMGDRVSITAEVVGINVANRTLVLRTPKDKIVTLHVSEEARNFDQIEIWDKLKITYYESMAVYIGKSTGRPKMITRSVLSRTPKGHKPGGSAVRTIDLTGQVMGIDRENRKVTVKGVDGKLTTTKVAPSVKGYDSLNVGDTVMVRFTESLAILVTKP